MKVDHPVILYNDVPVSTVDQHKHLGNNTIFYRVSQKKVPFFADSWHQQYFADLNDSNSS